MILNKEMGTTIRLLSELKKGQKGLIDSFTDYELSIKLLEIGCIPGEMIEVIRISPLGDPIAISVAGYILSQRKAEAETVLIKTN